MQESIPSSPLESVTRGLWVMLTQMSCLCSGEEGEGELVCCKDWHTSSVSAHTTLSHSGVSHREGRCACLWPPSAEPACFPEGKNLLFRPFHTPDPRSECQWLERA